MAGVFMTQEQLKQCVDKVGKKAFSNVTAQLRKKWASIRKQTGVNEWKERLNFPRINLLNGHPSLGNFTVLAQKKIRGPIDPSNLPTKGPLVGTLMVSDTLKTFKAFHMKEESEARLKKENANLRKKMRALEKQLKDFKAKEKTAKAMLELSKN